MRSPVSRIAALTVTTLLAACGGGKADRAAVASASQAVHSGPGADYPMVLGKPFVVDGVTYTPQDRMNYDQVGYAGVSAGEGISIAHRTLPLPSYAEVTSLENGRTILVRVTRRGPMTGDRLIDLSPSAAAQLGVQAGRQPIRVRRVNPPEPERSALREGRQAPARMDTPKSLVTVLRRKLEPGLAPAPLPLPTQAGADPAKPLPPKLVVSKAEPKAVPAGALVVQVGAYSAEAKSREIADKLGASVAPVGKVYRVRMGPFANRGQAEAALAKARAAGYSEARIQHAN